jgi:hypothetical protein
MQLFAAIKQLSIPGPDLQEITAIRLVFLSLPFSRTDMQRSVRICGECSFNSLYISIEARIQLLPQIMKKQARDAAGIEEKGSGKQ